MTLVNIHEFHFSYQNARWELDTFSNYDWSDSEGVSNRYKPQQIYADEVQQCFVGE